jgi:hypothetical protein
MDYQGASVVIFYNYFFGKKWRKDLPRKLAIMSVENGSTMVIFALFDGNFFK